VWHVCVDCGYSITVCLCDLWIQHHCRHCGQIFCVECLSKSVNSGPHRRPARVCDVCHTILVRDATPYFCSDTLHTPQWPDTFHVWPNALHTLSDLTYFALCIDLTRFTHSLLECHSYRTSLYVRLLRVLNYSRVLDFKNYSSNFLLLKYSLNSTSGCKFPLPVSIFAY